jgi:hypothetical protein
MRLGEVLNKIFRKRKSDELVYREPAEDIYKPVEHRSDNDTKFDKIKENIIQEQGNVETTELERQDKRTKYIFIAAGAIASLIIIALGTVFYTRVTNSAFKEEKVTITLDGPSTVTVGKIVEYTIDIKNKNRVDLKNTTIGLNIPSNFELQDSAYVVDKNLSGARISVGNFNSKENKSYKVKFKVNYSNDSDLVIKSFVKYKPNNVSSYFQTRISKKVRLNKSAIGVLISSAESVSAGELIELQFLIRNNGEKVGHKTTLSVEYPKGFEFKNSPVESVDEKHTKWEIGELSAGEQKEIRVLGRLTGPVDAIKKFKVSLLKDGVSSDILFEGERSVKIIPSKVIIKQESREDSIYPGSDVKYTISFKNNSTTPLRNLILKSHLPDKYIEYDKVKVKNGYYDSRDNVIIWKAGDVNKLKELQPNEEVSVDFVIRIKNTISFADGKNVNPAVEVYSEVESLDIDSPIFENKKVVSGKIKNLINSVVKVGGGVEYLASDNGGEVLDVLQVDKKTILRVKLSLSNTTNDLKDVKFSMNLPTGVEWEKQVYPEGDNMDFDSRSNKMEWKLGVVKAGTGFDSPKESAEFLISITPSVNQEGEAVPLINNMLVVAKDVFTGKDIEYKTGWIKSGQVKGLKKGVISPAVNNIEEN